MTKILMVTNPSDDPTTDRVIIACQERGADILRWHVEELLQDHVEVNSTGLSWRSNTTGRSFDTSEISAVWMRRPRSPRLVDPPELGSEIFAKQEIMTLLRYGLRSIKGIWYSHPDAVNAAENKLVQLKLAEDLGFLVPPFLMSSSLESIIQFVESNDGQVVIKPASTLGVSLAINRYQRSLQTGILSIEDLLKLPKDSKLAYPLFLQQRVDRDLEIRSTAIGRTVTSVTIATNIAYDDPKVDGRWGQMFSPHELIDTPVEMRDKMLKFQSHYGLNYGAFDFLPDKRGNWWFLECNPVGQFAWKDEQIESLGLVNLFADHLVGKLPPLVG
jgi:hypothetical protein